MKRTIVLVCAITLSLAGVAWGQIRQPLMPDQGRFVDHPAWRNREGAVRASDFIGMRVHDARGRDIGAIEDLMMDPRDAKVSHAVIGIDPAPDLTGRRIVVPWHDVTVTEAQEHVRKGPTRTRAVAQLTDAVLASALRYVPGTGDVGARVVGAASGR